LVVGLFKKAKKQKTPTKTQKTDLMVEIQNLTKTYGAQNAVDNISFTAEKGEIVGFLGPNGAGKSTTMKIATGYLPPTAGMVRVMGHDVATESLAVRRHVGYLPEHNPLYLDMYVHEYLEFIGSVHGLEGAGLRSRVAELVGRVGLSREQNKLIGALSKGYRQRVGLAQALIHNPDVLILDEPTTGLDPNQILEIRELIREVAENKTVIFSTHILPEVTALCTRVIIISRGKLVADSPVAELAARAAGETVVRAEFEGAVDLAKLQQVKGIRKVEPAGNGLFILRGPAGTDPRAAISRLAAQEGWILLGLRQEQQSLEEVFGELTK
jgi:ABC-2 type transport system ATP-binding protein